MSTNLNIFQVMLYITNTLIMVQFAEAVEYTDCISSKG